MNYKNSVVKFLFVPTNPEFSDLKVKQKTKFNCFLLSFICLILLFHGTMAIVKTGYFYSIPFRGAYTAMPILIIIYFKSGKDGSKIFNLLLYSVMGISFIFVHNQNTQYISIFLPLLVNHYLAGVDKLRLAFCYSILRVLQIQLYLIPSKLEIFEQIKDINELKSLFETYMILLKWSYLFCLTMSLVLFKFQFTRIKQEEELIRREELEKRIKNQEHLILSFSHELNNPIHTILNNLDELKQINNKNQRALELIQATKSSVSFLSCFVNNILDISKLDKKNNLELNPIHVKLKSFLADLWENCQTIIESKKLKSKMKTPDLLDKDKVFTFDPHRLRQVIYNIINNSIKYTSKGKIKLDVSIHSCFDSDLMELCGKQISSVLLNSPQYQRFDQFEDGVNEGSMNTKYLRFEIKDTGCGIDEQKMNQVFKKQDISQNNKNKQQQPNSLKLGVSLWLVKQIIQKLGGQIKIHSKVGQGTSVIITLPIIEQNIFQDRKKKFMIDSGLTQFVNSRNIPKNNEFTINSLIVEDVPFNQNIIKNYLAKAKIQVLDIAENGQIAVQKYKELIESGIKIDMICMDIEMPIMNGKEASRQIRKYEKEKQLQETRIFFVSGNTIRKEIDECLDKNGDIRGDIFLKKPLQQEEFITTIQKHMSEK